LSPNDHLNQRVLKSKVAENTVTGADDVRYEIALFFTALY